MRSRINSRSYSAMPAAQVGVIGKHEIAYPRGGIGLQLRGGNGKLGRRGRRAIPIRKPVDTRKLRDPCALHRSLLEVEQRIVGIEDDPLAFAWCELGQDRGVDRSLLPWHPSDKLVPYPSAEIEAARGRKERC